MMRRSTTALAFLCLRAISAQTITSAPTTSPSSAVASLTAVSECHNHGATVYCFAGSEEYPVVSPSGTTASIQASYTGCHAHSSTSYHCSGTDGSEIELLVEALPAATESHSEASPEETTTAAASEGENCHFHAGVEHCEDHGAAAESDEVVCDRVDRDYNIPLRIGLLFVMLVIGAVGVFSPMILRSFSVGSKSSTALLILKQFGTGVMVSTAFIHLFTHAQLMFSNPCIGNIEYEATTAAVFMAGLFLTFLFNFGLMKARGARSSSAVSTSSPSEQGPDDSKVERPGSTHAGSDIDYEEEMSVLPLEIGIIFHSILIGLTVVVAGDSFFGVLYAVIAFHQLFEGIALGTVIAQSRASSALKKILLGAAFTLITPIGMGIGIGVLSSFNGNDRETLIVIGTLDAVSAGILAWVALVHMWSHDWRHNGVISNGGVKLWLPALISLMFGMGIMSLLGKWA